VISTPFGVPNTLPGFFWTHPKSACVSVFPSIDICAGVFRTLFGSRGALSISHRSRYCTNGLAVQQLLGPNFPLEQKLAAVDGPMSRQCVLAFPPSVKVGKLIWSIR